jgi:hypothetical protein
MSPGCPFMCTTLGSAESLELGAGTMTSGLGTTSHLGRPTLLYSGT